MRAQWEAGVQSDSSCGKDGRRAWLGAAGLLALSAYIAGTATKAKWVEGEGERTSECL